MKPNIRLLGYIYILDTWQYVGKVFLCFVLTVDILIYWDLSFGILNVEMFIDILIWGGKAVDWKYHPK